MIYIWLSILNTISIVVFISISMVKQPGLGLSLDIYIGFVHITTKQYLYQNSDCWQLHARKKFWQKLYRNSIQNLYKRRLNVKVMLNNASDYWTNGLYLTPNPNTNPSPIICYLISTSVIIEQPTSCSTCKVIHLWTSFVCCCWTYHLEQFTWISAWYWTFKFQ